MEYRKLGNSGLKISAFSLGSWVTFGSQVDENLATNMLRIAYDGGVNFFDNAEVYADGQSEIIMGRALRNLAWGRDTYCVSSKVFWGGDRPTQVGLSRKHIFDACHAALKRLQLDYLDMYFCHRPDPDTSTLETVRAMHDLVQQGKVMYWGTSEWSALQIKEAFTIAREWRLTPPTMEQPEYNLLHRTRFETEYAPLFKEYGLGTTTWSPLASGLLTGKYLTGIPADSRMNLPGYEWLKKKLLGDEGKANLAKLQKLNSIAKKMDLKLSQFSLAWCLQNPNVSTVILGASREEQLKENLRAMESVKNFTPALLKEIDQIAAE